MRALTEYMAEHEPAMRELLRDLVDIQSGTLNKPGVDAVAAFLDSYLSSRGLRTRLIRQEDAGNILIADFPCAEEAPGRILLSGHMDTVFPGGYAVQSAALRGRHRLWTGNLRHERRSCGGNFCHAGSA